MPVFLEGPCEGAEEDDGDREGRAVDFTVRVGNLLGAPDARVSEERGGPPSTKTGVFTRYIVRGEEGGENRGEYLVIVIVIYNFGKGTDRG